MKLNATLCLAWCVSSPQNIASFPPFFFSLSDASFNGSQDPTQQFSRVLSQDAYTAILKGPVPGRLHSNSQGSCPRTPTQQFSRVLSQEPTQRFSRVLSQDAYTAILKGPVPGRLHSNSQGSCPRTPTQRFSRVLSQDAYTAILYRVLGPQGHLDPRPTQLV